MPEPRKTNDQSSSGVPAENEQLNYLARAHEKFLQRMRDAGLKVTEQVEADGSGYQVTFPANRSPSPARPTKEQASGRGLVKVTVDWGNDDVEVSITISRTTWLEIKEGEPWDGESSYEYEGEVFTAYWSFNGSRKGSLHVSYGDDGADGYIGSIAGAYVEELSKS